MVVCIERKKIMRIDNNFQTLGFGALNIKAPAASLEECSQEVLGKINRAGKKLKKTKYFNLEIDEDMKCKITSSKDAYFGIFKNLKFRNNHFIKKMNTLVLNDKYSVAQHIIFGRPDEYGYSIRGNQLLGNINYVDYIDTLADITKALDKAAIKNKNNKNAEPKNNKGLVRSLLERFGV